MKRKAYTVLHICTALYLALIFVVYFFIQGTGYEVLWQQLLFFSVLVGSIPFALDTFASLRQGLFGVDVIAIIAIWAGLAIGENLAAGIVLLMLSGGESLETYAENKARNSLLQLLKQTPNTASVYRNGEIVSVSVHDIMIGDKLLIKKGETIPVDGVVFEGSTSIDESVMSGEPIPRDVTQGDTVMSGTTNQGEFFTLKASVTYEKSMFASIVLLVKEAEENKAPTVRMANKYSAYFTIATISLATLAFFKDPKLAVAVLVVATPCPLILAVPIAFIAGMSKAARRGIIIKYGGVFENLNKVQAFFFDKTGTLTLGIPTVAKTFSLKEGVSEEYLLKVTASLEQISSHILAEAVVTHANKHHVELSVPRDTHEIVSQGIVGIVDEKKYSIGKISFLKIQGVNVSEYKEENSTQKIPTIYIAEEGILIGGITFSDTVRKNAYTVLQKLKKFNKKNIFVLITGDKEERAREIGDRLGFTHIKANCLPKDKEELIDQYENKGLPVCMIGDGVNDAPSLARASVGVALGSHGQTVATDIADAVITVDTIERVYELVCISRRTVRIAKESIGIGMGLSFIAMGFAYAGYLSPVNGAILQEGIDVFVILNALRAL